MARNPLTQPDRIAIAGDWHGDIAWACQAIWHAHEHGADTLIHLGDFGYQFKPHFLIRLNEILATCGMSLLFVDGNHDDHEWLATLRVHRTGLRPLGDWIWHVPRGFRWKWHGLRFVGVGGAHSVDGMWRRQGGLMWQPAERITDEQAAEVMRGGVADVMFSHDCPSGVDIPGLNPRDFPHFEILRAQEHRLLLRQIVDVVKPQAIWHGHYHVPYQQQPNFGWGPIAVSGLAENGSSIAGNLHLVDLPDLAVALHGPRT